MHERAVGKASSEQNGHSARLVVAVVEDHQKVGAWCKPAQLLMRAMITPDGGCGIDIVTAQKNALAHAPRREFGRVNGHKDEFDVESLRPRSFHVVTIFRCR